MIGFDDELEQGYADSNIGANVSQAELDLLSYPQDRICYAEQRLYPPVALGHLRMTLKPFSDDRLNRIKVECIL
jgi:hypothetical protein